MGTGRSISWETSILTAMDDPPFPTLPIGAVAPIVAKAARTLPLPRIPLPRTPVNSDVALRHRALPGGIMGYQDRRLEKERSWQRKARRYTRLTTSLQVEIGFGDSARSGSQER